MDFVENLLTKYNISGSHTASLIQIYLGAFVEATCNDFVSTTLTSILENIIQDSGGMSIKAGLEKADTELTQAGCNGSEPDRKKVVLVIASDVDDVTHDPPSTVLQAATVLKDKGVEIHAIGVDNADRGQLEQITGSPSRVTMVPSFLNINTSINVDHFVNKLLSPKGWWF